MPNWDGKSERRKPDLKGDDHDTLINLAADMHNMVKLLESQKAVYLDHESRLRKMEDDGADLQDVKSLEKRVNKHDWYFALLLGAYTVIQLAIQYFPKLS